MVGIGRDRRNPHVVYPGQIWIKSEKTRQALLTWGQGRAYKDTDESV